MEHLTLHRLMRSWPAHLYAEPHPSQLEAFRIIAKHDGQVTLELPTGTGKTAVGYTALNAVAQSAATSLFYIVPTKTLVDQVKDLHPDMHVAYGRHEHDCLYYGDEEPRPRADEIPCLLLVDCPHRVNQETGETLVGGVAPCPYYQQKFEAKRPNPDGTAKKVVATMSFYLFTQLFSKEFPKPELLIIDEAHRIADVFRNSLSYDITDYQLQRAVDILEQVDPELAYHVDRFKKKMIALIRRKNIKTETLLESDEILELLDVLYEIDMTDSVKTKVQTAIRQGLVDTTEKRETLTKLQNIFYDLKKYVRSLEYSVDDPETGRRPLNYTIGFVVPEKSEQQKVFFKLVIKAYYVAPLVKRILGERTIAYSATVGDPKVFGYETGIKLPFASVESTFSADNTRVFLPADTPNLAMNARNRQDLTRTLRKVAKACRTFADHGYRSLVIVVSNQERLKFLDLCEEENVQAISYGDGVHARDAATIFKSGEGDVLAGTEAHFGEGVDLPDGMAPVTFILRPGYPRPDDPATQFEERRFGNMRWGIWNWRVMLKALQGRGRNVRSVNDRGVTFFISQQVRRFLFAALPSWLQPAYRGDKKFDDCVQETLALLRKKAA